MTGNRPGLSAAAAVTPRTDGGTAERSTTYSITSRELSAAVPTRLNRRHRAIESECQRVLDVTFGEDADRNAAADLGVLRRAALGRLKRDGAKIGNPGEAFRAAPNTASLEKLPRGNAVV